MPVLVQGGDSQSASQRDLTVFALCSLIDKRDASKSQLNIIAFSVFCSLMAIWGLKLSLGATCILLCISFALHCTHCTPKAEHSDKFRGNCCPFCEIHHKVILKDSLMMQYMTSIKIEIKTWKMYFCCNHLDK